jgi:uncharacterized protein (TIGR03067 family)
MRRVLVLTAAVVALAADPPEDHANKKDLTRLQGVWQLRHTKEDGEDSAMPSGAWVDIVISGSKFALVLGHIAAVSGSLTLDATKEPPAIDVAFEQDKVFLCGIYEVKEGTLRICFTDKKGKQRPKEFDAKKGSPYTLWVLKRKERLGP